MTTVVLGNRAAIARTAVEPDPDSQADARAAAKREGVDAVRNDGRITELVRRGVRGKTFTLVDLGDEAPLGEAFTAVTSPGGVWAYHADQGARPAWVASDSEGLAALLAEHFGGIEVRPLEDPYQGRIGPVAAALGKATSALASTQLAVGFLLAVAGLVRPSLKTNAGNDFQANQMAGTPSATAVAKYVGITANATAPAAGDTTLTGEIATAGGGLVRKAGTYAHTGGAASYTITTVFTTNASDVLPVTVAKRGIFDAAAAGNLVFSTLVTPTATLSAVGDQLTLTDTVNT